MTTISSLPTSPTPADTPAEFDTKAFNLIGALQGFVTQANTVAEEVNINAANASSSAETVVAKAVEASASAAAALANKIAAETSEANAAASSVSAANNAAAIAAALDNFDDRYLGPKADDPALDNDGNALVEGALYSNTTTKRMRIYFLAYGWVDASSASVATLVTYEFVATTAAQTSFSGNDSNGILLSYTVGAEVVLAQGTKLKRGVDYTASNGSSIVLVEGLGVGQELSVLAFGAFAVANTYLKSEADATFQPKNSALTAISAVGYNGFKNRIINGAFQIWQRGTTISSIAATGTVATYAADRWCLFPANTGWTAVAQAVQVIGGGLRVNCTTEAAYANSADVFSLQQRIEGLNCYDLAGQQVTVSFKVKTNKTGNYGVVLYDGTAVAFGTPQSITVNSSGVETSYTLTFTAPASITADNADRLRLVFTLGANTGRAGSYYPTGGSQVNLLDSTSNYFEIDEVQLEKSSIATSFDYRPYGTELALCQRYYWRLNSSGGNAPIAAGNAEYTTRGYFNLTLPQPMRAAPTPSISNIAHFGLRGASTDIVCTSGNFAASTSSAMATIIGGEFNTGSATGASTGGCVKFIWFNAAAWIDASAEF